MLYRPLTGPEGFQGDVLTELPSTGWLSALVRYTMAFVVVVSAPLLVVPCGEIVEGKLGIGLRDRGENGNDSEGDGDRNGGGGGGNREKKMSASQLAVRLSVCVLGGVLSVMVPAFVNVISFVGTFCVAIVSFVFPPLLHAALLWRKMTPSKNGKRHGAAGNGGGEDAPVFDVSDDATNRELKLLSDGKGELPAARKEEETPQGEGWIIFLIGDVLLLLWGVLASTIASMLTFRDLMG